MSSAKINRPLKTVGIWLGFTEPVNLHREGIGRFLRTLCFSLVRDCDVSLEFWCYESNRALISGMFNNVLEQAAPPTTATFFSERHCGETRFSLTEERNNGPNTSGPERSLEEVAERYSIAQVFFVYSLRLHNVLKINRPKVVYVPDLAPLVYSELSQGQRGISNNYPGELRAAIEAFAESGAAFCCNSPYVAREHLQKYMPLQAADRIFSVFLPGIHPESQPNALDEAEVKRKYGLSGPFLFYPTQNRPYKRLELLIEALARLNSEGLAPDLVLTASRATLNHVQELAEVLGVTSRLVFPGEVSSFDLYALHRAAAVTVVTTLFEGGFPWQAIESMSCGTPVVMSRIPVVEERLKCMDGVSCDDLVLFEPDNLNELCHGIGHALRHRAAVVESQNRVVEAFNRYTWSDVAFQYHDIFANQANSQCRVVSFTQRRGIRQTIKFALKKCWPISYLHDLYLRVQSLEHSQGLLQSEIGELRNQLSFLRTKCERDRTVELKEDHE